MVEGEEKKADINLAGKKQSSVSDKIVLNWEAPSFQKNDRTIKWYLGALVIIVALIAYSAWQQDWFVIGVTIVVSAVMFWYIYSINPRDVVYKITPIGFYVDDKFYPFSEMHSFWMVYNESVKNIYIAFNKKYLPALIVNIEAIDPVILEGYLLKKIPEQEDRGENLADKLTRIMGL